MEEIKKKLLTSEYDFLRTDSLFGNNIIMLCVSGSWSYGTNTSTSDLDIRGVSLDLADDLLCFHGSKNISDTGTDTQIFQFNSFLDLLTKGQPNQIELFGLKPEHYLYTTPVWNELYANREIFLSQHIIHRIKGYADGEFQHYPKIQDEKKRWKSQMHIIRLYAFGIEVANGHIQTFREKEHNLLMDIRNGKYSNQEYQDIVKEWKEKLLDAEEHTHLPLEPNMEKIEELRKKVNKRIICNCI